MISREMLDRLYKEYQSAKDERLELEAIDVFPDEPGVFDTHKAKLRAASDKEAIFDFLIDLYISGK